MELTTISNESNEVEQEFVESWEASDDGEEVFHAS